MTERRLRVGVIGDPVAHSLSPTLHNAAFDALGLDWVYVAFPVPRGRGADAVTAVSALGLFGLNVTMPHKEDAASACDELTADAAALRSVNTVVARPDGRTVWRGRWQVWDATFGVDSNTITLSQQISPARRLSRTYTSAPVTQFYDSSTTAYYNTATPSTSVKTAPNALVVAAWAVPGASVRVLSRLRPV